MIRQTGNPGSNQVRLLAAYPSDAPDIGSLAREIWPVSYRGIIPAAQIEFMLGWMYAPSQLAREMGMAGFSYRWIVSGDSRAGFIATERADEYKKLCHLHKFYLHPEFQNRGIGSRAMGLLIDLLIPAGSTRLELRVNRNNAPAIAFYRKNGFEVFAEDRREIGGGFFMDDFLMSRPMFSPDPTRDPLEN